MHGQTFIEIYTFTEANFHIPYMKYASVLQNPDVVSHFLVDDVFSNNQVKTLDADSQSSCLKDMYQPSNYLKASTDRQVPTLFGRD